MFEIGAWILIKYLLKEVDLYHFILRIQIPFIYASLDPKEINKYTLGLICYRNKVISVSPVFLTFMKSLFCVISPASLYLYC